MAEIVHQQPAACRVRWAGILPQEGEPCAGKRLLHALPENRKVVGIHADTDDMQRLRFGVLTEIPVHRCGFSIAHGCDHCRHGAAGNRPQALLQPLRYVNGVQIPFWLWHNAHLQRIVFSRHSMQTHGCRSLHHLQLLIMPYCCLYERNISLFSFYIIMFYTARCSFFCF